MFLVDTNCWMEVARARAHSAGVRQFLLDVPDAHLFISIYSVHSIGVILRRRQMPGIYGQFLARMSIGATVGVITIPVDQLGLVDDACTRHHLDFDDAYQYVAAELHNLRIVSFDTDFDRTPRGRLEPLAALAQYQASQRQNP